MDSAALGFNPAEHSDAPLFNIQAVSSASGVPSITLRSWERRYGVPSPQRDDRGYRLYSHRDIAIVRWLRERIDEGVGISRAINMLRVLQAGRIQPEVQSGALDAGTLQARILEGIREMDEPAVARAVRDALLVGSVEEVCLQVIQPALYRVGELWQSGDLSVTVEHFGSNFLRGVLTQLIRLSPNPYRHERIIVGTAPGEMHDMGVLMLALFLRRRGFDVLYLGASVESDSFVRDVLEIDPAAVCLSASLAANTPALSAVYAQLARSYHGLLAFGGRAYQDQPELISTTPGVFIGVNAADALHAIESVGSSRH